MEWLRRLSVELLKESPSPALRSCWATAQTYPPLARFVCVTMINTLLPLLDTLPGLHGFLSSFFNKQTLERDDKSLKPRVSLRQ